MSNVKEKIQKINFTALLKLLSVPVFMLISYPLIAGINGFFSPNKKVDILVTSLLLFTVILSGMLGFVIRGLENKIYKKNNGMKLIQKVLIRVMLFLFVTIPIVIVFTFNEGYISIAYAVIAIAAYVCGFIFQNRPYSEIITRITLYIYVVADGIVVLLLTLLKIECNEIFFIVTYIIFAGVYFVVKNQSNIDYLMERRQHKLEHLPKKIRYYNMYLILGVLGLALVGFIARKPLANLILMGVEFVRQVILAIWRFIAWLGSLNKGKPIGAPPGNPSGDQLPFGKEETSGAYDPTFIIITILVIIAILLIIRYRKKIAAFLKRVSGKIKAVLKKLFVNSPFNFSKTDESTDYYYDEVEAINKDDIIKVKKAKSFNERVFKKEYKQYMSMPEDMNKMIFGYKLMINWFSFKGIDITKTDTTIDILQKVVQKNVISNDEFSVVTDIYNYIKFGNTVFTKQSLQQLDKMLSAVK